MGIIDLWRQARCTVMRKEYEDVLARMDGTNKHARAAFLNNIDATIDEVVKSYSAASPSEPKVFLRQVREQTKQMCASGDWPSALGAAISCLNAESRFVPGDDAAYARSETDRLVKEACKT